MARPVAATLPAPALVKGLAAEQRERLLFDLALTSASAAVLSTSLQLARSTADADTAENCIAVALSHGLALERGLQALRSRHPKAAARADKAAAAIAQLRRARHA